MGVVVLLRNSEDRPKLVKPSFSAFIWLWQSSACTHEPISLKGWWNQNMNTCCLSCMTWQWSRKVFVSACHLHWQKLLCRLWRHFWWVCSWCNRTTVLPFEKVASLSWSCTGAATVEWPTHVLTRGLNKFPFCTTSATAHWRRRFHSRVPDELVAWCHHYSRCREFCTAGTF